MSKYTADTIAKFKAASKAFALASEELLKVEAHKLEESSDKFMRIRAVRAVYMNDEIVSGKPGK